MGDTFLKSLHTVITGVRQLEELSGVLVAAATEDALLCVARDYGHDYATLLKKYKEEVVRRHASGTVTDKSQCRGTTKGNKQCGKRAQLQGYCMAHAAQLVEEEAKRRKMEAYRASVPRRETISALVELMGIKHVDAERYAVRPSDHAASMALF